MKKKALLAAAALITATTFSGCATVIPTGVLYTDVSNPIDHAIGDGDLAGLKKGESFSQSYLGLIAVGDASITTAAKNGKIRKIKYVERKTNNILGLIGTYTTVVYGD